MLGNSFTFIVPTKAGSTKGGSSFFSACASFTIETSCIPKNAPACSGNRRQYEHPSENSPLISPRASSPALSECGEFGRCHVSSACKSKRPDGIINLLTPRGLLHLADSATPSIGDLRFGNLVIRDHIILRNVSWPHNAGNIQEAKFVIDPHLLRSGNNQVSVCKTLLTTAAMESWIFSDRSMVPCP